MKTRENLSVLGGRVQNSHTKGLFTCGRSHHLTCKGDHIKMGDYMDRRVTSPKRVTSPIWGPPPSGKQALNLYALCNRALGLNEFVNKCNGTDTH